MTVKAALLDENGTYLRMDEVADASALTDRHLPQIEECDLPPGLYVWVEDKAAPMGGAFWPIAYLQALAQARKDAEDEQGAEKYDPKSGKTRREFAAEQRAKKGG